MYNFIVICIDCLRFDRFKRIYEHGDFLNGTINAFGTVFENAYTTAPWTYPATNSLLTGLYPHNHGAYHGNQYKYNAIKPWPNLLNPRLPQIFSLLKNYGYFTLGISTIYWSLNHKCNYSDCDIIIRSDEQEDFYKNTKSEWVIDKFIMTYEQEFQNKPFFAYLHLIDLHRPFDLRDAEKYASEKIELLEGIDEWDLRAYLHDNVVLDKFKENKVKLYDALIKYIGVQVQVLFDFLVEKKILENTVVIITSDHGEEFWDHTNFVFKDHNYGLKSKNKWLLGTGHGHTLFNELVKIPLIFINPKLDIGQEKRTQPVSLIDIYPTILDLISAPSSNNIDGISLFKSSPEREILVEATLYGYERKSLIKDSIKYVSCPEENLNLAYNLTDDPSELKPLRYGFDQNMFVKLKSLF